LHFSPAQQDAGSENQTVTNVNRDISEEMGESDFENKQVNYDFRAMPFVM
jgi:hypothetical protein